MITDRAAYERMVDQEQWDALRAMTIEESIAVGEALLTSEIMDLAEFADDDHPLSLALALGISPDRAARGR